MSDDLELNENSSFRNLYIIFSLALLLLAYRYLNQRSIQKQPELSVEELMKLNFPEEHAKKSKKKPEAKTLQTIQKVHTENHKKKNNKAPEAKKSETSIISIPKEPLIESNNKINAVKEGNQVVQAKKRVKKQAKKKINIQPTNLNKRLLTDAELKERQEAFLKEIDTIRSQSRDNHKKMVSQSRLQKIPKFENNPYHSQLKKNDEENYSSINILLINDYFKLILAFLDQFKDILALRQTCKFMRDTIDRHIAEKELFSVGIIKDQTNIKLLNNAKNFFSFFKKSTQEQSTILSNLYKLAYFVHPHGFDGFEKQKSEILSLPEYSTFYELDGFKPSLTKNAITISVFFVPITFKLGAQIQSVVTSGFWVHTNSYKVTGRSTTYNVPKNYLVATVKLDNYSKQIWLNDKIDLQLVRAFLSNQVFSSEDMETSTMISNSVENWRNGCLKPLFLQS